MEDDTKLQDPEDSAAEELPAEDDQKPDFYTTLNCSRTATDAELKAAYRRLSVLYHPDKHSADTLKTAAEARFRLINEAYEVLSDPNKRSAYDLFGSDADATDSALPADLELTHSDWQVGPRLLSRSEIRAEYERSQWLKKRMQVEQTIKATQGNIEVTVNATPLFDGYLRSRSEIGLSELLEVSALSISQSTDITIDDLNSLTVAGVLMSNNGQGQGYVITSYHRQVTSSLWVEADVAVGATNFLAFKVGTPLTANSNATVTSTFRSFERPPDIEITVEKVLSQNMAGWVTYQTGAWQVPGLGRSGALLANDSILLGIRRVRKHDNIEATIQAGLHESGIGAKYTYRPSKITSLQVSTTLNTSSSPSVSVGINRAVFSKNNRLGASVQISANGNLSVKVRATRYTQSLSVPILITNEWSPRFLTWFLVAHIGLAVIADRFVLGPLFKKRRQRQTQEYKSRLSELMTRRRHEVADAIELMQDAYSKKVVSETRSKGLIITKAIYGDLQDNGDDESTKIDVTVPLQMLVTDSQLILSNTRKSDHMGFFDPCPWKKTKQLSVEYTFHGQEHYVVVGDLDALVAPMIEHKKL